MKVNAVYCTVVCVIVHNFGIGRAFDKIRQEERVISLNNDKFDLALGFADMIMVAFVTESCRVCTLVLREYEKAANQLRKEKIQVTLASIDVGNSTQIAKRYAINRVPSYKLFLKKGKHMVGYRGIRIADAIVEWLGSFEVKYVSNQQELTDLCQKHDMILFAHIPSIEENTELIEILEELALYDLGVVIAAYTGSKSEFKTFSSSDSSTVFYRPSHGAMVAYDGAIGGTLLVKFIEKHMSSSVVTFSRDRAAQIFDGSRNEHVLVFYDFADRNGQALESVIRNFDSSHGELNMTYVLVSSEERSLLGKLQIRKKQLPAVMLVDTKKVTKTYLFHRQRQDLISALNNMENELKGFIQTFRSGQLTPLVKSTEPVDDSNEIVKTIVGSKFQEAVMSSDKDILLIFTAPWCSYCKAFTPIYTQLAGKYASIDSIMIAKMDATKNAVDHPEVNVIAYPTIVFFPAGDKNNPVTYQGHRDIPSLAKFLMSRTQYHSRRLFNEL
uniref:Protein disulfideisomerase putative n=1 Tax=Albugo laibachii Nc14 TaxID=890382 RepID=F0WKD7_9STRA|nr:protein disulfideisomerase putative [Albugo laibachii Nc14]|eukprot:CCA21741.1 protein disulfideisomerase putative [Albugo laibachii Nc14]